MKIEYKTQKSYCNLCFLRAGEPMESRGSSDEFPSPDQFIGPEQFPDLMEAYKRVSKGISSRI